MWFAIVLCISNFLAVFRSKDRTKDAHYAGMFQLWLAVAIILGNMP